MEPHKCKCNDDKLPHKGMSLEYKGEVSPEGFACVAFIKVPCNLRFSTYINVAIYQMCA